MFVGFTGLIVYDLSYNISNLPYTYEIRDRFMSPEEHMATELNLGDYERSSEFAIGFSASDEDGIWDAEFNPLDNDYIEVISGSLDFELSSKKGVGPLHIHEGPELEICSRDRMIEFLGAKIESYKKNFICLKDKRDSTIYSNIF